MVRSCLCVDVAGLRFENPLVLASGVLGYSVESFESVVAGGAGGVVTKSVGLDARVGYVNPAVFQAKCGLVNAMGLPNPGVDEFVSEVRRAKEVLEVPLIVSVYGFSENQLRSLLLKLKKELKGLNIKSRFINKRYNKPKRS